MYIQLLYLYVGSVLNVGKQMVALTANTSRQKHCKQKDLQMSENTFC
jgi:hypothetical protein